MANPQVVPNDMTLYCALEPQGRMFLKGEPWPGDAWSAKPGGKVAGSATTTQALKDLAEAQDQIAALQAQLESALHDLAQASGSGSELQAEVATLRQAAADATRAKDEAEAVARQVTVERDNMAAQVADLSAKLAAFDPDRDGKPGGAVEKPAGPAIDAMKAEYLELTGEKADGRWAADRLAEELAKARQAAADAA